LWSWSLLVVAVVVKLGGGGVGWYLPRCVAGVWVIIMDGGERVEGCGLRLWQFVSHTCHRHNIFSKLDHMIMLS
jgi:hypothetical protein